MSWFLSLILVGAVVSTGTTMPNYNNHNAVANDSSSSKTIIIGGEETKRFEKTYSFNPDGKIEVSNVNGSIYIEAWDRPEIYLSAKTVADTKERLDDVDIDITSTANNFKVSAEYQRRKYQRGKRKNYGKLYVTFRLKVPRTAVLDDIETVNGSVNVSNMTNYTEVSAVNGAVKASNLRGTAKLSTVNGTVYADFDDLNDSSSISLGTVNGSVKLNIPSNANATVKANTVNGSISNEFGLPIRKGKYVGRDLYGRIGSGNVKVRLSSVNGGLSINNKDGGTTNPAVNLLKQKTSDDFDESFEGQMAINTAKMNKQISKSVSKAMSQAETNRRKAIERQREIRDRNREKQREIRNRNREKQREIRDRNREKQRESRTINKERLKEIERETERIEEGMVRASEALYLSRRSPFVQEKSASFEVLGVAKIDIDAEDCDVVVKGWNKNEVKYTVSRITRTGNNTKDLRTRVSHTKTKGKSKVEIEINNESPNTFSSKEKTNKVRLEVYVPKKSNLKVSSDQEVRLEGVNGELELNGSDGSINVRDSYGKLKLDTSDANVRVIGFDGELEEVSVDSNIYLEGNFTKIRSKAKDGNVYLTLPDRANATITTNSEVDFEDVKLAKVISIQKNKTKVLDIGNGGYKYNFDFVDGNLTIRSKSSLSDD